MIPRELYLRKIRPFIDTPVVKVLTGVRRCGKSVMLSLIRADLIRNGISDRQVLVLNFESRTDSRVKSIDSVLEAVKTQARTAQGERQYLFFDEIQELVGWETLVNSFFVDFDVDIYITGSNAYLLSGELATYLAGRYVEIQIYPFSFSEVIDMVKERNLPLSRSQAFQLFLIRGGFPFLYNYDFADADARQYVSDIFDSIILKDISQRNGIRDVALLRTLILFFIANIGNTFSSGSLVKFLRNERRAVSTETIYNYIEYCRSACLLHLVPRQDLVGKAVLTTQEKIYLVDHGIREAVYGNNLRDINQVLESIVYIELLRRGYDVTVGRIKSSEVDFCAVKGNDRLYVQVAYLLASEETMDREFGVLEMIPDNYPKYVLSMDELDRSRNGIIHLNIPDFLLGG